MSFLIFNGFIFQAKCTEDVFSGGGNLRDCMVTQHLY